MAVGGEGVRLFASESYDKRLKVGQSVQYFSTSKGKWMDAVVQAVDNAGAVQLSVKPRAWINQEEQSSRIRNTRVLTASPAEQPNGDTNGSLRIAESSHQTQRQGNGKYTNGTSTHGTTNGAKQPTSISADIANRSDRSRALYSLFSEWDAQQQGSVRTSKEGSVAPGRIPPSSLRQELKVFKEKEKDIRQYKLFLLQQPQRCVRKRVTSLLWSAFYKVIRDKCAALRSQQDRRRSSSQAESAESSSLRAEMEADFTVALTEAETCLQHICAEVKEKAAAPSTSEEDAERLEAHREILGHLHIMLADLERYRAMSGTADSTAALARAEKLYCASLGSCAELGQAFNQRGLVAAHQGNKLKAVRCGFHSMLCAIIFPKSEQNLLVWLGQVAEDVATPQTIAERLRGTPAVVNPARAAAGAVCQLQLALLQQREGDPTDGAQRQKAISELITTAQGKIKEAMTSDESHRASKGLEWILETLMISICAAAFHRRCQPQANGKPTVLDKLMDGYTSTAYYAWDWVVRFGLCLAEETREGFGAEDQSSAYMAPLSLLCLLATRLIPHSWRSSVSAPLHDALRDLKISGEEQPGDESLLRAVLPEDQVAAGILPVSESEIWETRGEGATAAASRTSEDEASEDEVVLQKPVVKIASPEKKGLGLDAELVISQGSPSQAPAHLHMQVRRARLAFCLRTAAEGAAKETRPDAPPPRAPEAPMPLQAPAFSADAWTGDWGNAGGRGWAQGYEESSWPAWGNDEWGDGWAETHMDEGQTLEELGEEPDLWDMPDMPVAADQQWFGGYGYATLPEDRAPVAPGYDASAAWMAPAMAPPEAWFGMARAPPSSLPPAPPGTGLHTLGPPPGLCPEPRRERPEADVCHLPMVDLAFLDEDADADPRPSMLGPSALGQPMGALRRPPPPSCLPPPPPRGH